MALFIALWSKWLQCLARMMGTSSSFFMLFCSSENVLPKGPSSSRQTWTYTRSQMRWHKTCIINRQQLKITSWKWVLYRGWQFVPPIVHLDVGNCANKLCRRPTKHNYGSLKNQSVRWKTGSRARSHHVMCHWGSVKKFVSLIHLIKQVW